MTATTLPRTDVSSALNARIRSWFAHEFQEDPNGMSVTVLQRRTFSTIYEVHIKSANHAEHVICKQLVDHEQNRALRVHSNASQHECDSLSRAAQDMNPSGNYCVPTVRGSFPEIDSFLMNVVCGRSLESWLPAVRVTAGKQSMMRAIKVFQRVGEWLRQFQAIDSEMRHDRAALSQTVTHCDDRLRMIGDQQHPAIPDRFSATAMEQVETWAQQVSGPIPFGNCHGDFGPWNVIVEKNRLTVLDFFAFRRDCLLTDVLGMLVYLEAESYSPSFSARRVKQLQAAFLRGLALDREPEHALLTVCEAHQRIRRIHDCALQRPKRWSDRYRLARVMRHNLEWFNADRSASNRKMETLLSTSHQ